MSKNAKVRIPLRSRFAHELCRECCEVMSTLWTGTCNACRGVNCVSRFGGRHSPPPESVMHIAPVRYQAKFQDIGLLRHRMVLINGN